MGKISITYLYHSGFIVEFSNTIMVFDYYKDPSFTLDKILEKSDKDLYFFVSHNHYDHFSFDIFKYKDRVKSYFMHSACKVSNYCKNKIIFMDVYDNVKIENFELKMYGSTDEGGSFFLRHKEGSIFHAGDLNWWHWSGESDLYNQKAKLDYFNEINCFYKDENEIDFLFFPVDSRLENAKEWGIKYFLDKIKVNKLIIPMHTSGIKWVPSYEFKWKYGLSKIWTPNFEGDFYKGV